MKTLYVADLDGTLLCDGCYVSDKSVGIINDLIEEGLLFSVATARSAASAIGLLSKLKLNLPVVLNNGVFFTDIKTNNVIKHYPLDTQTAGRVIEIFKKHDKYPFMNLFDGSMPEVQFVRLDNEANRAFFESRKSFYNNRFYQTDEFNVPKGRDVVYFSMFDRYDYLRPLHDELSKIETLQCTFYRDSYSDNWFFEVFSKNAGKGTGVLNLKEYAGAGKLVVFGDNSNDISMFNVADESCAMGNALEELKEMATLVIGTNNDDGVAEFLRQRTDYGKAL